MKLTIVAVAVAAALAVSTFHSTQSAQQYMQTRTAHIEDAVNAAVAP